MSFYDIACFLVDFFRLPSSVTDDISFVLCFTPMLLLPVISALFRYLDRLEIEEQYLREEFAALLKKYVEIMHDEEC